MPLPHRVPGIPFPADLRKRRSSGASAGSRLAAPIMAKASLCGQRGQADTVLKRIPEQAPPTPTRQSRGAVKALCKATGRWSQADLTLLWQKHSCRRDVRTPRCPYWQGDKSGGAELGRDGSVTPAMGSWPGSMGTRLCRLPCHCSSPGPYPSLEGWAAVKQNYNRGRAIKAYFGIQGW